MTRLERLLRRPFLLVFGAVLVFALAVALSYRVGPGQDFHYHAMAARIAARTWLGDPAYAPLYASVNPLDANTLFYVIAFPFEIVLGPLDAVRVVTALTYFVGYPAACAAALKILGRSPWGALLAVPLAYNSAWTAAGFLPFCTSAPLFVLAVALLTRALEGALSRRALVATGALCVLLFCAHANVYAWTVLLFGVFTGVVLVGRLALGAARGVAEAGREALRLAGRMSAVVAPSLALFAWWWLRAQRFAPAEPPRLSDDGFHVRISRVHTMLALTKGQYEFLFVGLLGLLVLALVLFSGRPKTPRPPVVEVTFLLTAFGYVVFPWTINDQGVAARNFDMAMWLLPLVVYPHALRHARLRHVAALSALLAFVVARTAYVAKHLRMLDDEFGALFALSKQCPRGGGELAYAAMDVYSKHFWAASFYHAHETYAVLCGLDAPVFDSSKYPFNLVPLRYHGAPPVKPVRIFEDKRWYEKAEIWAGFDYVLVRGFEPGPDDALAIAARGDVAAVSAEWTLYRVRR